MSKVGSGAVWTNRGEPISNIIPEDANKWLGGAVAGFHRAELHAMLLDSDGGTIRADLLVGADGIQSIIRQKLFGKEPLRNAGDTA